MDAEPNEEGRTKEEELRTEIKFPIWKLNLLFFFAYLVYKGTLIQKETTFANILLRGNFRNRIFFQAYREVVAVDEDALEGPPIHVHHHRLVIFEAPQNS
jgi:hypothetical protein